MRRATRRTQLFAALCAAVLLLGPPLSHAQQRTVPPRLLPPAAAVIGVISGGVDGTYIRIATDLASVLDGPQLRIVPIVGRGSLQNIDDVLHLRGAERFRSVIEPAAGGLKLPRPAKLQHVQAGPR